MFTAELAHAGAVRRARRCSDDASEACSGMPALTAAAALPPCTGDATSRTLCDSIGTASDATLAFLPSGSSHGSSSEVGSPPRLEAAEELPEANAILSSARLPGGLPYIPVSDSCCLLPLCDAFGIPSIAICLGASFFQRLLARNPR